MIFDTHMHTRFSTDSRMTLEEAVGQSRQLGLGIVLTEHMDLAYPEPAAFTFDVDAYFQSYGPYRSDSLLLGIEIGMRTDCLDGNREIIERYPFDYCIGSIHVVDNMDIYQEGFYLSRSKQEVYHQYFSSMADCLACHDFVDSLGHIDYIARYARYADPEIYCHELQDDIDQVLKLVAAKGKAMEINTRRLQSQEFVDALLPVYQRFYQLGGRYVTIGSDAHKAADIGRGLATAQAIADHCQLKVVKFKGRRMEYVRA